MLTRYACTAAELSCVIGNIFAELSPPCAACGAEVLQITGTTVTGNAATLTVTEAGFDFDGCADDTAMIERMRKGRCIYAKTGAGAERTDGIQRDCESERPCKAHLHDHELDLRDAQEYRQRQKLQAKALTYCKELLFFIELSQEMGFISMSSCEYWSKLALEVKYMTTAWKKRDKTRA